MTPERTTIQPTPMGNVGDLKGGKPAYESPRMIPLGELARGSGRCQPGSFPGDECTLGIAPLIVCQYGLGGTE
jgi:hypothetical protein